jgi:ABC-type bacteriocin/lantibiotic exporter with double-glycine peptidase domain
MADDSMKLVNDMVTGIRTIKCYGWEQHYIDKLNEVRDKQLKILVKINIMSTLGVSVFQNMGLIAVLLIFIPIWAQHQKLEMA